MQEKSREQKLRRAARRQNLIAMKGKNEWGTTGWMIIGYNNIAIEGYSPVPFNLTIEEAEAYIYGSDNESEKE